MSKVKTYFVLERQKNPIFWDVYGRYSTYEQVQEGLAYWQKDVTGPYRIVKETRELVQFVE